MIPVSRLAIPLSALAALLATSGFTTLEAQEGPKPLSCSNPELKMERGTFPGPLTLHPGNAVEPVTGKSFFLDYPCDLKPGDEVTFILNLHGGGSIANWQRHYFPIFDYKDQYKLIIASPSGGSPTQLGVWSPSDYPFLQNVVTYVYDKFSDYNIKAFWFAGHSQGGATSRALVCTEFFRDKVDGFVSLSGGRVGSPAGGGGTLTALRDSLNTALGVVSILTGAGAGGRGGRGGAGPGAVIAAADAAGRSGAGPGGAAAGGAAAAGGRGGLAGAATPLDCDFSHIYATGELEATGLSLPSTSTWAERYGCGERVRMTPNIVDAEPGYVYDSGSQNPPRPSWGRLPRPGTAEWYVYPNCRDGRIVADFVRIDKGHTEGLEPNVTEQIVKLIVAAGK
jgi:hypothetical protein